MSLYIRTFLQRKAEYLLFSTPATMICSDHKNLSTEKFHKMRPQNKNGNKNKRTEIKCHI